jgi:cyclomaltodextrin glucanotransferase
MKRLIFLVAAIVGVASCAKQPENDVAVREYYGTLEPFAAEAVYFLLTDRFVDGDASNNYPEQGGPNPATRTFDRPVQVPGYEPANIGYLGGDFKGVLDNAGYIADMGFTAIWTTPIVNNPDEAFTGSKVPGKGPGGDRGKTGYHGYWGVNFFEVDEHLESSGLTFADFTRELREKHGLKYVLDVVCNHGSPAYTMPEKQPMFGKLYDGEGKLVADHQNLPPEQLEPGNPLHAFYNRKTDLGELSDLNENNPDVLDYFVAAYSQWLDQGVHALRIDTVPFMPGAYWKAFGDRLREKRPGLFMFAEAFDYDAEDIAVHTYPENGGISVLDFPGKQAMNDVFAGDQPYSALLPSLHLDTMLYENPYELMTFYDNHDMDRMDTDANGFIDANNWLFTSRGIPVVYYGSEIAFRAGTNEHTGNRDYFGQENIDKAKSSPIRISLKRIAEVRKNSIALQRGLQVNALFTDDTALFFRVYQKDDIFQTALVLLNKSDAPVDSHVDKYLSVGTWRDAFTDELIEVPAAQPEMTVTVEAHGVRVLLIEGPANNGMLLQKLDELQSNARRRNHELLTSVPSG